MARSPLFRRLVQSLHLARHLEARQIPTAEGLERLAAARARARGPSRRAFLGGAMAATAGATFLRGRFAHAAGRNTPTVDVAIVGAGLAGLTCADTLRQAGVAATLYEGRDRVGGRCWSMGPRFPGPVSFGAQTVERGGELIDNLHKTMLGYAQEFGLAKEDVTKAWVPGETTWYLGGRHVSDEEVVDEFRAFVDRMRDDLTKLSSEVLPGSYTPFDREVDRTTLAEYLVTRGAGPIARAAIDITYDIEYGRSIAEQSALNFLFFIHADKRARFTPFGVYSDERYHLIDGNEGIARGIRARLPGPVELGSRLVRVAKTSGGRVELTFDQGGRTVRKVHDAVVLATPFSTLRQVELDPSLGLPAWKTQAIRDFQYGTNAKLNVGFNGRFWAASGSEGASYSDLPNHQATWEPNPTRASATEAVLLDYSSGARGAGLDPRNVDREVDRWLGDLDRVLPGARAAARKVGGRYVAHLQHWPSDPMSLGSYTCNAPGYFTSIAGHEGLPVDNLYFAGEHTDLFYEWQGFMEGAATSGIRTADEVLADFG